MNMKKIIPLTFTALSVAGALSACSDSKIVGADVQDNSMAQRSSSSTMSSSSSKADNGNISKEFLARLKAVESNKAVAIVVDDFTTYEDSVNASETYSKAIESIIDYSSKFDVASYEESITMGGNGEIFPSLIQHYAALLDESRMVHGPTGVMNVSSLRIFECMLNRPERDPNDLNEQYRFYFTIGVNRNEEQVLTSVRKDLLVYDSLTVEEFKKDCAAENGTYSETSLQHAIVIEDDGTKREYHNLAPSCEVLLDSSESVRTYADPYFEKYASKIIDRCVVPYDSFESSLFDNSDDSEKSEQ